VPLVAEGFCHPALLRGRAVLTTDAGGRVTFLNPVAESLTGWLWHEAKGQPLETVFRVVNDERRRPSGSPAARALSAMREGLTPAASGPEVLAAGVFDRGPPSGRRAGSAAPRAAAKQPEIEWREDSTERGGGARGFVWLATLRRSV